MDNDATTVLTFNHRVESQFHYWGKHTGNYESGHHKIIIPFSWSYISYLAASMPIISLRRRSFTRLLVILFLGLGARLLFFPSSSSSPSSFYNAKHHEILEHNVLERVTRSDKTLNVQKHKFLQVRMGRDERDDLLGDVVRNGVRDYWDRFQKP